MAAVEVERFRVAWYDDFDNHFYVIVSGQFFPRTWDSLAGPGEPPEFEAETVMNDWGLYVAINDDSREAFEAACASQYETHLDTLDAEMEDEGGLGYIIRDGKRDYDTAKYLRR